jgi:diguanylate cyclase (GGDEF)-like protein
VRFGVRLTLFFTVTLLVIQLATFAAIQTRLRATLIQEGETQIAAAETRFIRQLSELEDQLAEGVRLLTLDFALRQAIAQNDAATVVSALRNHGHRVGASRMLLIAPDGTVTGDTAAAGMATIGGATIGPPAIDSPAIGPLAIAPLAIDSPTLDSFPDPALLDQAAEDSRAGRVAILDARPVWLVVVPVMAPDLIAYVAAALPLDDAHLLRMRDIAGVPGEIGIVSLEAGVWRVKAGMVDAAVPRQLPGDGVTQTLIGADGDETIVTTRALATAPGANAVRVVLDYPLSDVLRRYWRVSFPLVPIMLVGLLATLAGATVVSRGVARPIEELARRTKRIAEGDYTSPPPLRRTDELGQLSLALSSMTRAIAEREQRVHYQATHDPVTGLANRPEVAAAIAAMASSGHGAILVVGLIRWHDITGTVGRDVGDRLLREAAARLRTRLDCAIGSIGESTFAVLLPGADLAAAGATAARLIDAFDQPYREAQLTIDNPIAVGIALLPDHGTEAAQLLRRAEVALAAASTTEARLAVYRTETDPHRPERLSLMSDLRSGLTRGEFQLFYQPKLDLKSCQITGAEALVRWNHPTRGLVMPDDFITLAEETGNIQQLTRWALRTGLTEARYWRDQGLPVRVSINLSVRDLADDTLPIRVAGLLMELQMPPRALVLEITESAIMGEPNAAIDVLRRLDAMGIALAIDDFGVGQSSLAYLRRLPVREIKLDKAFSLKLADSPDDQSIVRAVTEMGHGLGYHVTAEGVEDARCLRLLRRFGCDHAQGYYVGKPMPSSAFLGFVGSTHDRWVSDMVETVL